MKVGGKGLGRALLVVVLASCPPSIVNKSIPLSWKMMKGFLSTSAMTCARIEKRHNQPIRRVIGEKLLAKRGSHHMTDLVQKSSDMLANLSLPQR